MEEGRQSDWWVGSGRGSGRGSRRILEAIAGRVESVECNSAAGTGHDGDGGGGGGVMLMVYMTA